MIDLHQLRANPAAFVAAWKRRGESVDVQALLALDEAVRALKTSAESKKAAANAAAAAIGKAAREGKDVAAAKAEAKALGDEAKALDEQRAAKETELTKALLWLPNPPLAVVPDGKDAAANRVAATWGSVPQFAFTPKPHWDIGPALGIMDFERGAKLSGSGFVCLRGLGAKLSRALISYFLDTLTNRFGYTEWAVPYLVRPEALVGTTQLPKFADQLYACRDDELLLIPTAEVPVTNLHAGEVLDGPLPRRYCAHTPCFRREAGAAGVGTRGMTRVHQFDKVEMVWLTELEKAEDHLVEMRGHAEHMLRELGLHHRVLELCAGDTGFGSAHTFDLEVYSPGTKGWLEVSSCSNFGDFQARRANLRWRPGTNEKPRLLATLNGSGLALPRVLIGIIEYGQQADGSVKLPAVLHPYMGGVTSIGPAAGAAAG